MDRLAAQVWRTIRRFDLLSPGVRVIAALSGGADSMALVHLLHEFDARGRCRLVGLAHLHHGLRGDAADEDEAFCRAVAADLGLSFDCERVDVGQLARRTRRSIETAGHAARYAYLGRAALRLDADRVALGHTRDDQAETVLLRLIRGAGPRGLAGMYPRAGMFIRPMLDCSRRSVRHFVAFREIPFREDASNQDLSIPRNLLRSEVMPALSRVSAAAPQAIGRAANIAREDAELLERVADDAFARIATITGEGVALDLNGLRVAPAAIARRVVAAALKRASGGRSVGFSHVQAVLDLSSSAHAGARHLPGQLATRRGNVVLLRRRQVADARATPGREASEPGTNSFRFSLSIPGEVVSPFGWAMSADRSAYDYELQRAVASRSVPAFIAIVDGRVEGPLVVRGWRPGDRFRPLGLGGSKKLQDFFVDRKVAREERGQVPIVVDTAEHVVWVAGHAIAEDFRVTGGPSDVVILKLKYWRNGT